MKCVFKDPVALKRLLATISHGVDIVNFHVNTMGMKIRSMNSCKSNLLDVVLDKTYFEMYECMAPESIGVCMGPLETVIKMAGNKDTIHWQIKDNNQLQILIQDAGENKTLTQYTLKTVDFDEDQLDIPPTTFDIVVRVGTSLLRGWVKKVKSVAGNVTIEASTTRIGIKSVSDTFGEVTIQQTLPSVQARVVGTDSSENKMTISTKAMEALDVMAQCAPSIDIGINSAVPLYCIGYLDQDKKSMVSLWIAPIMDDD